MNWDANNEPNNDWEADWEAVVGEEYTEYLNGTELYWEVVEGDTDDGEKAPVVFLHGLGYHSATFRALCAEALAEHLSERSVIYLDQRGCGRSGELRAQTLSLDTLVEDLEALREHMELDKIVPLGHGFGALIALEYARRYPRCTERVIVVNPWVHYPELALTFLEEAGKLRGESVSDPAEEIRRSTPEGLYPQVGSARLEAAFSVVPTAELFHAMQFKTAASRLQLEFLEAENQLIGGSKTREALVAQGLWEFEYAPFLTEIRVPVTVVAGLSDKTSYPNQVQWASDLTEAPLYTLDTGHFPWLDDADEFAKTLAEILE